MFRTNFKFFTDTVGRASPEGAPHSSADAAVVIETLRGEKRALQDRLRAAELETVHLRRKLQATLAKLQKVSHRRKQRPASPK